MDIIALIIPAALLVIGIIKIRLIEQLVSTILPNNKSPRLISFLVLFGLVLIISSISQQFGELEKTGTKVTSQEPMVETKKSELEVKVDAVKDGIALADQLVQQGKENKRLKDSTFISNRVERWVYRIGDWTDDDERILELRRQLLITENIKMFKQGKRYLFIKEDHQSKEQLMEALSELKEDLNGVAVDIIDLNSFLTRKKNEFLVRTETFGKRKKKIELECLIAE